MSDIAGNAAISLLAVASVSLWTLRVALAARGRRVLGAAVAAVEAMTFVVVFRQIGSDLGAVDRLAAYGVGVAVGTLVGLTLDRRLASDETEATARPGCRRVRGAQHGRGRPSTAAGRSTRRGSGAAPVRVAVMEDGPRETGW